MGKIKSKWMQEVEPIDDGINDFIFELQAFSKEFSDDNDRAEERDRERARQFISVWEV
jgi:hypothetical protein